MEREGEIDRTIPHPRCKGREMWRKQSRTLVSLAAISCLIMVDEGEGEIERTFSHPGSVR